MEHIMQHFTPGYSFNPRSPDYIGDAPEATDTVRGMLDRFGPVEVEYERKGAKVVAVYNSTGKDIYWLLDRMEQIDVDYVADEAWSK
jgi:hypothetical protein